MGVKASGGVRTAADALQMVAAGATRIGTSGGVRIVQEFAAGITPGTGTPGSTTADSIGGTAAAAGNRPAPQAPAAAAASGASEGNY
jgi:hypothetical protein